MKILVTTFTYPPAKDGVAEASRQMAEGLAKLGWDIHVATSNESSHAEKLKKTDFLNGVRVHRYGLKNHQEINSEVTKEIQRYHDFVATYGFDIIINHCWEAWPTVHLQSLINRIDTKWVHVSHGYALHIYTWHPYLTMGIGQWIRGVKWTITHLIKMIHSYDRLIFLSNRKDLGRFFDHRLASIFTPEKISIIPNSTEIETLPISRADILDEFGVHRGPVFICIANYSERKNQKRTLHTFRKSNIPDSTLIFIGSAFGEYGTQCIKTDEILSGQYPNPKVLFLEKLNRGTTLALLEASDVFILTAKAETQPISLIEAMSAAKPWISTDTGCVSEMEGGIVCKSDQEIIQSIHLLADNIEIRNRLGGAGRIAALRDHDLRRNIVKFGNLLSDIYQNA